MRRMRALIAIAILVSGIAGIGATRAADLPRERAERTVIVHRVPFGWRAGPLVIYDFEPGVVVRAYWLAPWRHRHYFPFGGTKHDADVAPGNGGPPEPAESFERYWSTSQTFIRELPSPRDEPPPPAFQK
jgi:hypothetical protein